MKRLWSLGLGILLVAGTAGAQGTLFGGLFTYGPSDGLNISGNYLASSFTLGSDATLTSIDFITTTFIVGVAPGPQSFPGGLDWAIFTGNGTVPSGVVAFGEVAPTSLPGGTQDWNFATPDVSLTGDTQYWLGLKTDDGSDSGLRWNTAYYNDACVIHCIYQADVPAALGTNSSDGPWTQDVGAFHQFTFALGGALGNPGAQVSSTPEPSSVALLMSGLLGAVPFARKRRRGC